MLEGEEGNINIKHKVYPPPNTGGVHFCAQNYYCCLERYKLHDM
jgi:hypothetical protein